MPGSEYDTHYRTLVELTLIHEARHKGIPIMGVCRGHQIIHVYHGIFLGAAGLVSVFKFMDYILDLNGKLANHLAHERDWSSTHINQSNRSRVASIDKRRGTAIYARKIPFQMSWFLNYTDGSISKTASSF